ncbi:hypothetical protein [Nannocystis sp.]|uniref:hypothetical protein n=1 Tax=Nannocystis sp. TaxID=1962667 RepID=UPI0025DC559E|nr:hypothetical protein [Nannocystis sp.]MBK7825642.1 hypothetical protein [Nannocystis sp.]
MRNTLIFPLTALLACGPVTAPPEDATTTTTATSEPGTTTTASAPTTTSPESTSTSSDATTTTTATGTTHANDFIIQGDILIREDCNVFTQNCPRGQKCAAWAEGGGGAWNATKCVDITGDGAPGDPCATQGGGVSGMDDCGLGSMCWDVDENNQGTCVGLCTGTPAEPMCPPMFKCYISSEGVLNLCIPTCDPLLQDCPGTELCIPNADEFICVSDDSGDAGQTNDPCEFANSCDKGLLCLNTAAASIACDPQIIGCCQPFCKFPGAPCPNPDQQCVQWYDPMMPIPPEYQDVGVCAIPL